MSERWPAAMPFRTACEYLGVAATSGRKILDHIPSIQHLTGEIDRRGERYWVRQVLDDYLESRLKDCVKSQKA